MPKVVGPITVDDMVIGVLAEAEGIQRTSYTV